MHLKHLQHVLSSQHLLAEVVRHGNHSVDSGHDLLVGNGGSNGTLAVPRDTTLSSGGVARNELERGRSA